jgi:retron-type reverse transcriptase
MISTFICNAQHNLRNLYGSHHTEGLTVYTMKGNMYGMGFSQTRGVSSDSALKTVLDINNNPPGETREKSTTVTCTALVCIPQTNFDTIDNGSAPNTNEQLANENLQGSTSKELKFNYIGQFVDAISVDNLKRAWLQLKSNPGMLTEGSNDETIHNISDVWFEKVSAHIAAGKFKYPPARRKDIPKGMGKEGTRPLTITNPRIKVIERAILNSLEPIFEGVTRWVKIDESEFNSASKSPDFKKSNYKVTTKKNGDVVYEKFTVVEKRVFLPTSFGFRPGRSAHQALHNIKLWRSNTVYLLDYDIKKAFDSVNKNRLENIFNKYVKDPRFFEELNKLINAGYIKDDILYNDPEVGVNQGSILSPFLFNIYMHEFDLFIDSLNKECSANNKKGLDSNYGNPEARKSYGRIIKRYTDNMLKTLKELGSKEKFLADKEQALKEHYKKYGRSKGIDTTNRLIQYARYADDFLLGIIGPREFAIEVKQKINCFLKSNLHLKVSKDSIVHRDEGHVNFLGHTIKLVCFNGKVQIKNKQLNAIKRHKARVLSRLKTQDRRLASALANRGKKKMLVEVNNLLSRLKIKISDKNVNLVSTILAFKDMSDAFAKTLNLKNGKELLDLTNKDLSASNPAIDRWTKILDEALRNQESIAATEFLSQLKSLRNDPSFETPGIGKKLKGLLAEYIEKCEALNAEAKDEITEKRKSKLLITHTNRQNKKASRRLHQGLTPEEEAAIKDIAPDIAELDLKKNAVRTISVGADLKMLIEKLRLSGYVHPARDTATSCESLLLNTDVEIIKHYNAVMYGILNWFSGADNFNEVKGIVESILRFSCQLTLKRKFKLPSLRQVSEIYGKDIQIVANGKVIVSLVTKETVASMPNKFNLKDIDRIRELFDYNKIVSRIRFRTHALRFFEDCAVEDCRNKDIEVHHIAKLQRKINAKGLFSVVDRKGKRVTGLAAILTAINRKQIPLCRKHHLDFENNIYHPIDISVINGILGRNSKRYPLRVAEDLKDPFEGKPFKYKKNETEDGQSADGAQKSKVTKPKDKPNGNISSTKVNPPTNSGGQSA